MGATIKDVASYAGVSVGTVSKYINGGALKQNNQLKIEEAIENLKFKPNKIAKGLRNAKTYTVAILVSSLNLVFIIEIINSIEKYLSQKGYSMILCDCQDNPELEFEKVKQNINRMVDGLILMPCNNSEEVIEYIQKKEVPLVLLDKLEEGIEADGVVLDNVEATYLGMKNLIQNGHEKIAIITGDPSHYTAKKRIEGYIKALVEAGIPVKSEYIVSGDYTVKGGKEAFHQLWDLEEKPTAIFASNYDVTLGAYMEINNYQLSIPEDLSIVGFDMSQLSEVINPKLSVVGQPLGEMGDDVARLLYKRMQKDYESFPELIMKEPYFECGNSVKNLKKEG
ncbi:MAG: LacI family DNA-binding transcriptional regulator [Eubacteriales bacterium]